MKQVIIRRGTAEVEEVPAPMIEPGTVIVRVDHSCISVGTEMSGVRASATPLWRKAVQQPQKVRRVVDVATTQGIDAARHMVSGAASAGAPTGYSASGTVIEVGESVSDLRLGDRVACAGAQAAHHAELIRVPRNLTVPVPESLSFADASTVTLGAIALQGVRRAMPTMGEAFVVVGLGVLGQLTAQLLRANGCRVIGIDPDRSRVEMAMTLGMNVGLGREGHDDIAQVERLTGGIGADGVIITASTPSNEVVSSAFQMTRRKGRVVLVGDVGLDIDRADMYAKELDFFISTSYGPGRYDANYEEHGIEYPVGYVRWTENRNMSEYLRLLSEGLVQVMPLVGSTFALEDASAAYQSLQSGEERPVMVLLAYVQDVENSGRVVPNPMARASKRSTVGVAVVGAGSFAKGMHLPNLQSLRDSLTLKAIVSRTGFNAVETARQFGAGYSTTDYQQVLDDTDVDLVIITTRHDTHAGMALQALRAGKHVLVEKPLALKQDELDAITTFYAAGSDDAPILLTGFNRRFSRYGARIAELVADRSNPMILDYRMNAGYIPMDHWVHSPEGGGRNLGEACHIYDLFTYLTGGRAIDVQARSIQPATAYYGTTDNFVSTVAFDEGSVATLTYTALGSPKHAKERMEIYVDGKVLLLDDYQRLNTAGQSSDEVKTNVSEKGQREELEALVTAIRSGGGWPIPLWQQVQATEIALRVNGSIVSAT